MSVDLGEIARLLSVRPEELLEQGVRAYVAREIRLAEWDIADIKERYGVSSRSELEAKIQGRSLHSHPAWEDLIHWENLDGYVARLRTVEQELAVAR